jgi:Holliday junction resolvasome RuvABC DNA-binding subunit
MITDNSPQVEISAAALMYRQIQALVALGYSQEDAQVEVLTMLLTEWTKTK